MSRLASLPITIRQVTKRYGTVHALDRVDLDIRSGEFLTLLGPSGSGKTTLLRVLAGLETLDPGSGRVRFHDQDVTDLPPGKRGVGFVFQHYALFAHLDVFENVAFGLRVRRGRERPKEEEIGTKVRELLQRVRLANLEKRFPDQLSGGQRQRVAIARAVLKDAPVLILDEATSHLDAVNEQLVREALGRFARDRTTLVIAHRLSTVRDADQIVVLDGGRVVEVGDHDALLARSGLYARLVLRQLAGAVSPRAGSPGARA